MSCRCWRFAKDALLEICDGGGRVSTVKWSGNQFEMCVPRHCQQPELLIRGGKDPYLFKILKLPSFSILMIGLDFSRLF